MLPGDDGVMTLCVPCHGAKTAMEAYARRLAKWTSSSSGVMILRRDLRRSKLGGSDDHACSPAVVSLSSFHASGAIGRAGEI